MGASCVYGGKVNRIVFTVKVSCREILRRLDERFGLGVHGNFQSPKTSK